MNINDDFLIKAVVDTNKLFWIESPASGVERKYLDRIGTEVARASSLVRYGRNSSFAPHTHHGGEEILVLEGTFSDENGDYPAGTYLRNPPNSAHSPHSKDGCTIFVKLRQFHPEDDLTVRIDTTTANWYPGLVPGLSVMPLHEFDGVGTALVRWAPNTIFRPHVHPGGEEIFVLEGVFHDEDGSYPAGTWIRSPRFSKHAPFTKSEGATIYVKTGHLDYEIPANSLEPGLYD
ncbi:MAG: cupin domain-containing protein [Oxalobacteraceae bacterium]|nr:cupin domain-containing protein [Oxalobacteraceae bacterium]